MKIAVVCDSLLLKKCLDVFLAEHLCAYTNCDFVVSDKKIESEKPIFVISDEKNAHFRKPFSKTKLLKALDTYAKKLKNPLMTLKAVPQKETDLLEAKIKAVTESFVFELLKIVREHR